MRTRLPLRVDPLPGEWWRGYIHRVSATYGMPEFLLPRWITDTHCPYRRYERRSGVAVTDAIAVRMASQLNLTPDEVRAMHLSAYDGSALIFGETGWAPFDPTLTSGADRMLLEALGPLAKATTDRYCPACIREMPRYRAMSWRLLVHLVCVRHRLLLTDGIPNTDAIAQTPVPETVVSAQTSVLSHLEPSIENAAFFTHLEAQLKPAQRRGWAVYAQHAREMPLAAVEEFCRAVDRVTNSGYPDYQGFARWPASRAAKHLRAPQPLALPGPLQHFPHLLPTHLFTKGLSDLLHRAQIRPARAVAAVGALLCATGHSLDETTMLLPERRRASTSARLLEQLIQLEREGRAERFWALCAAAAGSLFKEEVDYRHREQVCTDEESYLVATAAEPSAYVRTVRTWLVDQWASTYTSSNVRPSVRDGSIEHFDRLYGPGMRAALARLVEESAA